MKILLSAFLVLVGINFFGGCATRDHRLDGRWKSNKSLTVATIHFHKSIAPTKRAQFEAIFGKLIINYDRTHVTAEIPPTRGYPAWRNRSFYRVVASDSDSLVYISKNPLTGKQEISYIHFDTPNRYWLYLGGSGWKEYFDRINSP